MLPQQIPSCRKNISFLHNQFDCVCHRSTVLALTYCYHAIKPVESLHVGNADADASNEQWRTHHDRKALGPADGHVHAVGF